jgi:hypothetical protein
VDDKTLIDRTTRFLVTLTLFGGAWYTLKGVTNLWLKTFSEIFYSKSVINKEHIFSMSLLIVMVSITSSVISYLYMEYKTYRNYEDNEEMKTAVYKADRGFDGIFSMINVSFISFLTINILTIFVKEIKGLTLLLLFFVGFSIGAISKYFLEEKVKNALTKFNLPTFKTKTKQLGYIIYISLIILILSLSLMILSLEGNQEVEVKIEETPQLPIEIILKNFERPTLEFSVYREKNPKKNVKFKIRQEDLQKSLVEVYETNLPNENFLFKSNIENKLTRSQNENTYQYTSELNKYILEGKNVVDIIIISEGENSKKTVRIATTIFKDGEAIDVPQKIYKVNP